MSKSRKFAVGASALAIAAGSFFASASAANADGLTVETCTTDYGARALCAAQTRMNSQVAKWSQHFRMARNAPAT